LGDEISRNNDVKDKSQPDPKPEPGVPPPRPPRSTKAIAGAGDEDPPKKKRETVWIKLPTLPPAIATVNRVIPKPSAVPARSPDVSDPMKVRAARVCLLLAALVLIFGAMMLCDCPGLFLLAVVLALVPVFAGARAVRVAGIVVLGVALVTLALEFLTDAVLR
jgi:hypothetical protein